MDWKSSAKQTFLVSEEGSLAFFSLSSDLWFCSREEMKSRLLESFQLTGFHAFRAARTGFCAISRTLPVHIIHQKIFGWESRSDLGENLHEIPKAD